MPKTKKAKDEKPTKSVKADKSTENSTVPSQAKAGKAAKKRKQALADPAAAARAADEKGLDFARAHFAPERFVLAVATFNERAITVYERAGFARDRVYMHWTNGAEWEFLEMSRQA